MATADKLKQMGQRLLQGSKDIALQGTPEKLSSIDLWVTDLLVFAKSTNSGSNFYVAFSQAAAVNSSGLGIRLNGLDVYKIKGDLDRNQQSYFNLADIWVDVDVNTDGVGFQYVIAKGNG